MRDAERELLECAVVARRERITEGVMSFVLGALEIGGGLTLALTTDDSSLQWLAGGLMAAGVGSGLVGVGRLSVRSEEERIAELWRTERALSPSPPRTSLRLTPRVGLGALGVSGSF